MYKFVFFDLDDTLLDFGACERAALNETLRAFDVEPTPEMNARYSAINDSKWKLFERGEIDRKTVQFSRFSDFFAEFSLPLDVQAFNQRYLTELAQQAVVLPGAEAVLQALQPHCQLFIASNGVHAVQQSRVAISGLGRYFSQQFNSEEIGVQKPAKDFFDVCFSRIPDFDPASAIIIGDSLSSDIRGGANAGIATCWFNPAHKPLTGEIVPDYEIERLEQVFDILL